MSATRVRLSLFSSPPLSRSADPNVSVRRLSSFVFYIIHVHIIIIICALHHFTCLSLFSTTRSREREGETQNDILESASHPGKLVFHYTNLSLFFVTYVFLFLSFTREKGKLKQVFPENSELCIHFFNVDKKFYFLHYVYIFYVASFCYCSYNQYSLSLSL